MRFSDAASLLNPSHILHSDIYDDISPLFSICFLSERIPLRSKTLYIGHIEQLPQTAPDTEEPYQFILLGAPDTFIPSAVGYNANIIVADPAHYTLEQLYDLMSGGIESNAKYKHDAEQLANALLSNAGPQRLIDVAFDIFRNPIWVVDSANQLIAYAFGHCPTNRGDEFGALIKNATVLGHVPNIEKNDLARIEQALARDCYYRFFHETFQREMIIRSVRIRGITVGQIVLLAQYQPFGSQDDILLQYLSSLLSQELQKSNLHTKNAGDMRAFFLNDLISSRSLNRESVQLWQHDVNFLPQKYLYVAVITPSDDTQRDMAVVASQLQQILIDSIFLIRGNELVVLINLNFRLTPDHSIRPSANTSRSYLIEDALRKQAITNRLTIGVSNMFHDLIETQEHYQQAKKITNIRDRYLEWDVVYFSTAAPMEILHIVHEHDNLLSYCVPELFDLLRVDREENSELAKTLYCYLETVGNTARASALLHVHKNTLLYRLEKIRSILGDDLKSGESFYRLMMSFRILSTAKLFTPPFHPLELHRFVD